VDELGSELRLLTNAIPPLQRTWGEPEGLDEKMEHRGQVKAKIRFYYAFQRFLRVVSSYFMPLSMVLLNDLQRVDLVSLYLLEVLIIDRDSLQMIHVLLV
jgi:predicted ATPase